MYEFGSTPVISKIVFEPLHSDTDARFRKSVSLQFERNPIRTSCSTREVSRIECGHPANFLLTWCQRVSRCANPFEEFKTARANAQNLSYSLQVNEFPDLDNLRVYVTVHRAITQQCVE